MAHTFDADDLNGDLTAGFTPLTAAFPMHWETPSESDAAGSEPPAPPPMTPPSAEARAADVPGRHIA